MKRSVTLFVAISMLLTLVSCGNSHSEISDYPETSYTITSEPNGDNKDEGGDSKPPADGEIQELAVRVVGIHENYIDADPIYKLDTEKFGRVRLNIEYPNELLPERVTLESTLNIKYRGKIKPAAGDALAEINQISAIEYHGSQPEPKSSSFLATVTEQGVMPLNGEWEAQYNYAFPIAKGENGFKIGDLVRVTYSGMVLETDPPQLSNVTSVELVDKSSLDRVALFNDGKAEEGFGCTPYTQTWQDGWVFSDGARWRDILAFGREDIPAVYVKDCVTLYFSEEHNNTSTGMLILKAGTKLDGSEELPEFGSCEPNRLNELEAGVYYVVIQISWHGEFIESEALYPRDAFETDEEYYKMNEKAFERGCSEYIFRLVV